MTGQQVRSFFYKVDGSLTAGFRRARSESVGVQKAVGAMGGGVKHTQTKYAMTQAMTDGNGILLNGGNIPLINQAGPSTNGLVDADVHHNILYSGYKASGSQFQKGDGEAHMDSAWERITIEVEHSYCIAEANYRQANNLSGQSQTEGIDYQLFHVTAANGEFRGASAVMVEYDNDGTSSWNNSLGVGNNGTPKYRRVNVIFGEAPTPEAHSEH